MGNGFLPDGAREGNHAAETIRNTFACIELRSALQQAWMILPRVIRDWNHCCPRSVFFLPSGERELKSCVSVQPNAVTMETGLLSGLKARVNAAQGASPGL